MSVYNGWSPVPLTPEETWEQRAEAFVRGMSEIDQAGDMLAVERARAARWKAAATANRLWARENVRSIDTLIEERAALTEQRDRAMKLIGGLLQQRDEARAKLMKRITRDAA